MALDINLLNVLLLAILAYLVYPLIWPAEARPDHKDTSSYNYYPPRHPDVLLFRKYTPQDLSQYDGVRDEKILLAIRKGVDGERTVFDVTAGKSFYGPGERAWTECIRRSADRSDMTCRGPLRQFRRSRRFARNGEAVIRRRSVEHAINLSKLDADGLSCCLSPPADMLTPLDKPLDELKDLTKSEM